MLWESDDGWMVCSYPSKSSTPGIQGGSVSEGAKPDALTIPTIRLGNCTSKTRRRPIGSPAAVVDVPVADAQHLR